MHIGKCRSRGGGNPALDNPVRMIQNAEKKLSYLSLFQSCFWAGFPPPRERHLAMFRSNMLYSKKKIEKTLDNLWHFFGVKRDFSFVGFFAFPHGAIQPVQQFGAFCLAVCRNGNSKQGTGQFLTIGIPNSGHQADFSILLSRVCQAVFQLDKLSSIAAKGHIANFNLFRQNCGVVPLQPDAKNRPEENEDQDACFQLIAAGEFHAINDWQNTTPKR